MHMIEEWDRGVVGYREIYGETWHRMAQYQVIDGGVPLDDAYKVVGYSVEKQPVGFRKKDGTWGESPGRYSLVRTDTPENILLHTAVSDRFECLDNETLLRYVEEVLLSKYPDVTIDSVGTLQNGKHCFVSVNLGFNNVAQDPSDIVGKLMYVNKYGDGALPVVAHTTRVVCHNTMTNAIASGAATNDMRKFRHTSGVYEKLSQHMLDLAEIKMHMNAQRIALEGAVGVGMNQEQVSRVVSALLPLQEDASERSIGMVTRKRDKIVERWDSDWDLQGKLRHTAYSMVQAIVAYADHDTMGRSDDAYVYMDGLQGERNRFKNRGISIVGEVAGVPSLLEFAGQPA